MLNLFPFTIFPLGDSAITIDFGNCIDDELNNQVTQLYEYIYQNPFDGLIECVPAYSSLTIYYNAVALQKDCRNNKTISDMVSEKLEEMLMRKKDFSFVAPRNLKVPVCYDDEFAPDIKYIIKEKKISKQELIQLHTRRTYRVYMIGFLPGFAYMGEVEAKIAMNRKTSPQNVSKGSVGIAGNQTGIYPMDSPGGWNIIGKTPVELYETNENGMNTYFKAGDIVQFFSISKNEFENY